MLSWHSGKWSATTIPMQGAATFPPHGRFASEWLLTLPFRNGSQTKFPRTREATMNSTINPFYASRAAKSPLPISAEPVRYAKLPLAPVTGSPVPHLTSLYHFDGKDEYGD